MTVQDLLKTHKTAIQHNTLPWLVLQYLPSQRFYVILSRHAKRNQANLNVEALKRVDVNLSDYLTVENVEEVDLRTGSGVDAIAAAAEVKELP